MTVMVSIPKPHEPCYCGSGKKYKKCHRLLDTALPNSALPIARAKYALDWQQSAEFHDASNHYDWMATRLHEPPSRVLDIGLGGGQGIAALIRAHHPPVIVALEENPDCIAAATVNLQADGYPVISTVRTALSHLASDSSEYVQAAIPGPISTNPGINIFETDFLQDPTLAVDLLGEGAFDLITVWLVGTHNARQNCVSLMSEFDIENSGHYRLTVQNAAYDLADVILRSGGSLQVVDRVQHQSLSFLREEAEKLHSAQAEPTALTLQTVEFFEYFEPTGKGIPLHQAHAPNMVLANTGLPMHLVSTIAIKA